MLHRTLGWVLLIAAPALARAAPPPVVALVAEDLAPTAGVVVGRDGDTVLVALDGGRAFTVNDLVAAVEPGPTIRHPETGEPLGRRDRVVTRLRVIRVRRGFSEAVPLRGDPLPSAGQPLRRFASLAAGFVDERGDGRELYEALREALPDLEWQGYSAGAGAAVSSADLLFRWGGAALVLRDRDGVLLRSYPVSPPSAQARPAAPAAAEAVALPVRVLAGAFGAPRGEPALAASDGDRVWVIDCGSGGLTLVALPDPGRVLGVGWWRPSPGGDTFLVVSQWEDRSDLYERPAVGGTLVRWGAGTAAAEARGIPYFLAPVDTDGDGTAETLVAQEYSAEGFFGPRVGRLRWDPPSWNWHPFEPPLPRGFRALGADLRLGEAPSPAVAAWFRRGALRFWPGTGGPQTLLSDAAGSLHSVLHVRNPEAFDQIHDRITLYPAPVILGGRDPEDAVTVVFARTERSHGFPPVPVESRIVRVRWGPGVVRSAGAEPLGPALDGAVQVLGRLGEELWVVVTPSDPGQPSRMFRVPLPPPSP
ncbi:hypothetical protein [Deferrisoma palaeochoriense]